MVWTRGPDRYDETAAAAEAETDGAFRRLAIKSTLSRRRRRRWACESDTDSTQSTDEGWSSASAALLMHRSVYVCFGTVH